VDGEQVRILEEEIEAAIAAAVRESAGDGKFSIADLR
jgi:hypothetical protein